MSSSFTGLPLAEKMALLHTIYLKFEINGPCGCALADFYSDEAVGIAAKEGVYLDVLPDMSGFVRFLEEMQSSTTHTGYQVVRGKWDDGVPTYHIICRRVLYDFLVKYHDDRGQG